MLKFAPREKRGTDLEYSNSCVSEYLGCHIFNLFGIPAQETLLGTYSSNGRRKTVVACKDFTTRDETLQDFAMLKNQAIDSGRGGYGTELSDILYTFHDQNALDPQQIEDRFWDMFIADALIGNWDRHNGNWGFLYNQANDRLRLAPVFDCGSSLCPDADEGIMRKTLDDENELNLRVYSIPTSAIMENGKRVNYFNFISSLKEDGCNRALERVSERIDMDKVCELVSNTPLASDLDKEFYSLLLASRKERILDFSVAQLSRSRSPRARGISFLRDTALDAAKRSGSLGKAPCGDGTPQPHLTPTR